VGANFAVLIVGVGMVTQGRSVSWKRRLKKQQRAAV
jgi:hypothetical protein